MAAVCRMQPTIWLALMLRKKKKPCSLVDSFYACLEYSKKTDTKDECVLRRLASQENHAETANSSGARISVETPPGG